MLRGACVLEALEERADQLGLDPLREVALRIRPSCERALEELGCLEALARRIQRPPEQQRRLVALIGIVEQRKRLAQVHGCTSGIEPELGRPELAQT